MGILDDILNAAKSEVSYKVGQKVRQEVDKSVSGMVGGQDGGKKCPQCGKVIADSSLKFCQNCGAALSVECPKCGADSSAGTKFCGGCGAALSK